MIGNISKLEIYPKHCMQHTEILNMDNNQTFVNDNQIWRQKAYNSCSFLLAILLNTVLLYGIGKIIY
jgi:hypothetical protein